MASQANEAQFYAGMKVVAKAIMESVADAQLYWDLGVVNPKSIPEAVVLVANRPESPKQKFKFSREQLEDSADSVERADVRAMVAGVIDHLKR